MNIMNDSNNTPFDWKPYPVAAVETSDNAALGYIGRSVALRLEDGTEFILHAKSEDTILHVLNTGFKREGALDLAPYKMTLLDSTRVSLHPKEEEPPVVERVEEPQPAAPAPDNTDVSDL